jgi:hypothetical protein
MGLCFTIAAGPRQHSHSQVWVSGLMTTFYFLRFETPPTWRARYPYLYLPGTGWPGYTTRHWVLWMPFSLGFYQILKNLSMQEVKYYIVRSTNLLILSGIKKNYHNSKMKLLLYLFLKRALWVWYMVISIIIIISGVGLCPLGTAATCGLLYKPQMIDEGDYSLIDVAVTYTC